jgi:von Willebrand factor type A domain
MRSKHRPFVALAAIIAAVACGSSNNSSFTDGGSSGSSSGGSGSGSGGSGDGGIGTFGDGSPTDGQGGGCNAPDMLIVLDHTDSMSAKPSGGKPPNTMAGQMLSKWYLATQAIKAVVAPPQDQKVSFGLEMFPLDPQTVDAGAGMGTCSTLSQLLNGMASTNKSCQPAEIVFPPAPGNGAAITTFLDPLTVRLCVSTPIALALGTAQTELASVQKSGVAQYILLVTDGGETCHGDVTGAAQTLAAKGIKTFVVGFGGLDAGASGVNVPLLDDVACAGETAPGFPAGCTKGANGYTATSTSGPPLFYSAQDGASLQAALQKITTSICCGCAQ